MGSLRTTNPLEQSKVPHLPRLAWLVRATLPISVMVVVVPGMLLMMLVDAGLLALVVLDANLLSFSWVKMQRMPKSTCGSRHRQKGSILQISRA
ncbi:hypothetical protein V8C34DRAFT_281299 [Trichoderma compactum]